MKGKKQLLTRMLDGVGATEMLLRGQALIRSPWLSVLTYHRIVAGGRRDDYPFDAEVIDATPEEFDRQVAMLKRYFTLVGVDELCAFAAGEPCPRSALALTFDDGYRDNHDVALPILKRHGVRATFFIATSYLAERRLFWWDRLAYLVKRARAPKLALAYPSEQWLPLGGAAERGAALKTLLRLVKSHRDLDLPRFLDELTRAAEIEWSPALERELAEPMLMSWDDVRALRDAGMDVQSHTRTHRVLATLAPATLRDELEGSRRDLESEIERPVRAIAYPVGASIAADPSLRYAVLHAGYQIGLTNHSGTNRRFGAAADPLDLRRIAIDAGLAPSYFRGVMALPILA